MPRSRPAISSDNASLSLARNRLGLPGVAFFVLAAAAPLTVIAGGATTGWAVTGVIGIPVAYLSIAIVLCVFSVGYSAMSRRIVNAGAFYSYVVRGLGRIPGVGTAFVALLSYNSMQIGLYGGFGAVTAGLLRDRLGVDVAWWVCAFVAWLIVAMLGLLRVDLNGRVLAVFLVAEITVAVVFAVVQVLHPANGVITFETLAPARLFDSGIGAGLVTAVAGFVGFEATAVFSEEARNPRRTVPRATYLALMVIGLLYTFCSWAMSVAAGPAGVVEAARTQGTELTFQLVTPYVGQAFLDLGHLLFATSLFAALLSFHNTVSRYTFALGRERVLPAWLGSTDPNSNAPKWGSVAQTVVAGAVLTCYAVAGVDPVVYLFFWLTVLGGLGVLILMAATSIAVVAFFARGTNREEVGVWSRLAAPAISAVALLVVLYLTLDQFNVLLGVSDPTSPWLWILPSTFVSAAVLGMLWGLFLRFVRPGIYQAIGAGTGGAATTSDETPTPDDSHVSYAEGA